MTRRRAIRTGGIGAALGFIVLVFMLPAAVRQQPTKTPPAAAAPPVQEEKPRTASYRARTPSLQTYIF